MVTPTTADEQVRLEAKTMIFDVDGTLIDSTPLHVRSWQLAFAESGIQVPSDLIHGQMGRRKPEIVESLLSQVGEHTQTQEAKSRIITRKTQLFADHIDELTPVPGARGMVEWFKGHGAKICLATSATRPEVDTHIETLGIRDSIDLVLSSEDVTNSKPHPEIVHKALEQLDSKADTTFFVGDSPHDIVSAVAGGVRAVGVLTGGYGKEELYASGAWLVLETVAMLSPDDSA